MKDDDIINNVEHFITIWLVSLPLPLPPSTTPRFLSIVIDYIIIYQKIKWHNDNFLILILEPTKERAKKGQTKPKDQKECD